MVPRGARLKAHQVFLNKILRKCFPSHGSPTPSHDTQERELQQHLRQTRYGSAKDYHHQLLILSTEAIPPWDKQESPPNGQNSSDYTDFLSICSHGPEFSACPSRMGTLGSTNLPWQLSVSEQSYPKGRPDTLRSLMAHC